MTGIAALLAALLGFASCARATVSSGPARESSAACAGPMVARADLDGDGRVDTVTIERVNAPPYTQTVVCLAGSRVARQPNLIDETARNLVGDVDGDGDDDLLAGLDAGAMTTFRLLRWDGARLSDEPSVTLLDNSPQEVVTHTFGCRPPNALVQVHVDWSRRLATVTTMTLGTVPGSWVDEVRVPSGADRGTFAKSLVEPCTALRTSGPPVS